MALRECARRPGIAGIIMGGSQTSDFSSYNFLSGPQAISGSVLKNPGLLIFVWQSAGGGRRVLRALDHVAEMLQRAGCQLPLESLLCSRSVMK